MAEPFLGQITMFGGNFAPRGWAKCDGQLLAISSNAALFSLLGTTYGGDGRSTYALPDLRGRTPIHAGQGPGLSNRNLGSKGGQENQTATVTAGAPAAGTANVSAAKVGTTMQPYLTVNYIIALQGVFPSRS